MTSILLLKYFIYIKNHLILKKFKNSIIQPNSSAFLSWLNPPVTIYRKYYLFDIANPIEVVKNLDKPFLIEKGPYVYKQINEKRNVNFIGDKLAIYSPYSTITFDESLSVGLENDTITFLNVPALV
jgi:hypothetical protein